MEYAIISLQGKQYKVTPGMKLVVDRLSEENDSSLTVENVLLHTNGEAVTVGTPTIAGAKVVAKVINQKRGKKISILRFRAKSHYHKARGHRQEQTELLITGISMPRATKDKAASA